jgi:hypothetical protein
MKVRYINVCHWCGIRVGAARSAFCNTDAKRFNVQLASHKHRVHVFGWSKQVDGYYGMGVAEYLTEARNDR